MLNWKMNHPCKRKEPLCTATMEGLCEIEIYHRKTSIFSQDWSEGLKNIYRLVIKVEGQEDWVDDFYGLGRAQKDAEHYAITVLRSRKVDIERETVRLGQQRERIETYLDNIKSI